MIHLTAFHSHSFIIFTHSPPSLDLSDDDDEGDEAGYVPNCHSHGSSDELDDDDDDAAAAVAAAAADTPVLALDAARLAVVEDLQLLLCSMRSAVDDQALPRQRYTPIIRTRMPEFCPHLRLMHCLGAAAHFSGAAAFRCRDRGGQAVGRAGGCRSIGNS